MKLKKARVVKRACALFLAAVLLLPMQGVTALAETRETEQNNGNNTEINTVSASGHNSVGDLLADSLNEKIEEQKQSEGCNIFSAEVSGNEVTVDFESVSDAVLTVAIYDEDGIKMLTQGSREVSAGEQKAVVPLAISEMPQYFYLRCFLTEKETLAPLCAAYESPNYTQEMQEFLAKTTEDFETEKVLNLDSSSSSNFAVYNDSTKLIPQSDTVNQVVSVDEASKIYIIEHADQNIVSLHSGDIFSCRYGDGDVLIVKVADISLDETDPEHITATITGADASTEEVFEYVKLEGGADTADASVDASGLEEGVIYEGMAEAGINGQKAYALGGEGSMGKELSFRFADKKVGTDSNNVKLTGSLALQLKSSVKMYLSFSYQYLEVKLDYAGKLNIAFSGNAKGFIPLAYIGFDPIPDVVGIGCTPSLVLEGSAKAGIEGKLSGVIGIAVSGDEGLKNLTSAPKLEAVVKGEAKLFVGLSLEPKVTLFHEKAADVKLEGKFGGEVKASISPQAESSSKHHDCKTCLSGEIAAKAQAKYQARLLNSDRLTYEKNMDFSVKLCDFYYSLDYNEFAFTSCPHLAYKIAVTVRDATGSPVSGAVVNAQYTTGNDGTTVIYLPNGSHVITASKNGGTVTKTITVKDNAKSIIMQFDKKNIFTYAPAAVRPGSKKGVLASFSFDDEKNGFTYNGITAEKSGAGILLSQDAVSGNALSLDNASYLNVRDASGKSPLNGLEEFTVSYYSKPVNPASGIYMGWTFYAAPDERMQKLRYEYYLGVRDLTKGLSVERFKNNGSRPSNGHGIEGTDTIDWVNNGIGWKRVTVVFEKKLTKIYVDGTCVAVETTDYALRDILGDDSIFWIGKANWQTISDGEFYQGYLDEYTIYNYALKGSEVAALPGVSFQSGGQEAAMVNGEEGTVNVAEFTGLQPGERYNFYVMKSAECNDLFQDDNLLYIRQAAADSGGSLNVTFEMKENYENPEIFLVGSAKEDLSAAEAIVDDLVFSGEEQMAAISVTCNGKPLLEGIDYELEGDFSVTDVGEYEAIIRGIGHYTNSFRIPFKVYCEHNFGEELEYDESGHYYVCSLCGYRMGTQAHIYHTEWSTDAQSHWKECECGEKKDMQAHEFEWVTDKEATEEETGIRHEECTVCGFMQNENTIIEKLPLTHIHKYGEEWKFDSQSHWKECECGNKTEEQKHEFEWVTDKEATEEETGIRHEECTVCGSKKNENTIIEKLPPIHMHDYSAEWKTDSRDHWKECECGNKKDVQAHTFEWITDKAATEKEAGIRHEECTICGYRQNENTAIEKLLPSHTHKYDTEWSFDEKNHWKECDCGAKSELAVHSCTTVITKATLAEDGSIEKICSVCGETIDAEEILHPEEIKLQKTIYTYSGKEIKPSIRILDGEGTVIPKTCYTVSYSGNKAVGSASVKIILKGDYSGRVTKKFKICPKGTSILGISKNSKGFIVKWKKQQIQTTGYEVQYSANKKFTKKSSVTKRIKKAATIKLAAKKVKPGKEYYVRIRTYKTVKGTKYYSDWSKVRSISVKKRNK